MDAHLPLARKACDFLTASPDPFHAVANSVEKLKANGFQALRKRDPFVLEPGGKYYYTINHSTLVAFTVGKKYMPGGGFIIIGGHTDSPNLKIKPVSKKTGSGCVQLGVECYGGGLWHTWFDRDLGVSGRVLVRKEDGGIKQELVNLQSPVARVSTLCIHLQSADERSAFTVNKETHTSPILGTQTILEQGAEGQLNDLEKRHEPRLLEVIAKVIGAEVKQMVDMELNLYDVQPASLGGLASEFLYSARLDNLATVFCSIEALVAHSADLSNDTDVSLVALFDHEEVGSQSAHGAGSPIMAEAVRRISSALTPENYNPDVYGACIRKSFVLSCDQAHAVHPNYASKHESEHAPKLNGGVVIKTNSNQRYTTNGVTGFMIRELGRKAQVPIQEFAVRNDCPCGSTIGPIISANTGIRTVDVGMPQLSMHSCREVMGIADCK
jgi:aspartyl aminopeptidase